MADNSDTPSKEELTHVLHKELRDVVLKHLEQSKSVCVFNLLQDIHQFALRQIDVYLWQARAHQKNTHHYLLITPYILIALS